MDSFIFCVMVKSTEQTRSKINKANTRKKPVWFKSMVSKNIKKDGKLLFQKGMNVWVTDAGNNQVAVVYALNKKMFYKIDKGTAKKHLYYVKENDQFITKQTQ